MRSPIADLLADLARAFDALGISWYLFGAQAAIVYGVARLTADVDVTARLPPGAGTAWLDTIESHGFARRFLDAKFAEQSRVIPITHLPTGLPVDIVLAGPGLEEQFLERAASLTIDGVAVPVIEVSDLVILKVLAGRPKDLGDLAHWSGLQRTRIDTARVRDVLGALEAALGQSDLLRTFEAARAAK